MTTETTKTTIVIDEFTLSIAESATKEGLTAYYLIGTNGLGICKRLTAKSPKRDEIVKEVKRWLEILNWASDTEDLQEPTWHFVA